MVPFGICRGTPKNPFKTPSGHLLELPGESPRKPPGKLPGKGTSHNNHRTPSRQPREIPGEPQRETPWCRVCTKSSNIQKVSNISFVRYFNITIVGKILKIPGTVSMSPLFSKHVGMDGHLRLKHLFLSHHTFLHFTISQGEKWPRF